MVHANRLKPYHDPQDRSVLPLPNPTSPMGPNQFQPPQTATDTVSGPSTPIASKGPWKEIDRLLQARKYNGKMYYKVKWADKTPTSWALREDISPYVIKEFHIHRTLTGTKRKRPLRRHTFFTVN